MNRNGGAGRNRTDDGGVAVRVFVEEALAVDYGVRRLEYFPGVMSFAAIAMAAVRL